MEREFELLNEYMRWWIDRLYITTLETKIRIFSECRYIEYGSPPKQLPDFKTWKKVYGK